ncbi:MAG: DNA polymerase III subunit gamma/tau [Eubacteriales bacterium]|nr:DNA polymerase III subunit gamma/tau [Eubacteriales bacterium]
MAYRALYRETRPEVFSELIGQESIVKIIKHQIRTGTVSHAYLFCGTRGTGKTTTARLLAKAVNCLEEDPEGRPCGHCENCKAISEGTFIDVIEIDAASNNGVDNIRELRESVKYPPAVGRMKVYIIDEVHMLSQGAYNALLKTLEEPPDYVIFILATTDPERLPQTVLSRCMRLDFRRVPGSVLAAHMKDITRQRGVEVSDDALRLIASNADGSVRDSLSILEQCLAGGDKVIGRDQVLELIGGLSTEFYQRLTDRVLAGDVSGALMTVDEAVREGKDVRQMMKDWMTFFRSLMIVKYVEKPEDMLNISSDNVAVLKEQSQRISLSEINNAIVVLAKAIDDSRYSTQVRILMEMAVVNITMPDVASQPQPLPQSHTRRSVPSGSRPQAGVPGGAEGGSAVNASAGTSQGARPRTASGLGMSRAGIEPHLPPRTSPGGPSQERPVDQPPAAIDIDEENDMDFVPDIPAGIDAYENRGGAGPEPIAPTGEAASPVQESPNTDAAAEPPESETDMAVLWEDLMDAMEADPDDHHHFWGMLRGTVIPQGIKGDEILLSVNSNTAKGMIKRNQQVLSQKLYDLTGKHLVIVVKDQAKGEAEEKSEEERRELEELAKKASAFLGRDVPIK